MIPAKVNQAISEYFVRLSSKAERDLTALGPVIARVKSLHDEAEQKADHEAVKEWALVLGILHRQRDRLGLIEGWRNVCT